MRNPRHVGFQHDDEIGVAEAGSGRCFIRHADGEHVFRTEGFSAQIGGEGRVDAAGETEDDGLEAALAHVVAQTQD